MNHSWSLHGAMRFSLTVALFIAAGGFWLAGAGPEAAQPGGTAVKSGLEGTTRSEVVSGVPGGKTTGGAASVEFAIAPFEGDKPSFARAVFVKSGRDGKYRVALPPGKYWIGPKAKAQGTTKLAPPPAVFRETEAVVTEGAFTHLDLSEIFYAP